MSQAKNVNITSRRAVLAGIATAPALAAPALALTDTSADTELRELWPQYLENADAERRLHAAFASTAATYKAGALWKKYDRDRLYNAWNEASERTNETVDATQEQRADGLFGIGAKLCALKFDPGVGGPEIDDYEDAIISALREIDRLIGTTFVSSFSATAGIDDEAVS